MGLTESVPAFMVLRFLGGLASALALILSSALVLERLAQVGRPGLAALHFSGVGIGIALSAALVAMQRIDVRGRLPVYDRALLGRELDLFPEWYLGRHLGQPPDAAAAATLAAVGGRLLERALAQPRVFVHRDYHSRNLMCCEPNPGILDFQDAVEGPITYDLASLFKDAYIDWDEALLLDWLARYWDQARRSGLPVNGDFGEFHRDFEWMGVQRHLKVLGIFARLAWRDGKRGYLDSMPRVRRYLRSTCARYRDLAPLARWLDETGPAHEPPG
jgi:aminoglycoside/choline kinase family phosphotransferase